MDSAEESIVVAEERIASVSTVIIVVLLRNILQSLQREILRAIFAEKPGMCRGHRSANRGRVGMINEDGTDGGLIQDDPEESASKKEEE